MYEIRYTKQAVNDIKKLKQASLDQKARNLIEIIRQNPFQSPPPYEKLVGQLDKSYSRRINRQHRLIYKIEEDHHAVIVIRMWTHDE